jgi:glycosyltransferase involved in cell wall biosynthesis
MRIALITRSCPIAATDGIARQRQVLAKALASRGHDVHVFTIGEHPARGPLGGSTVHTAVRPRHANPWFSHVPVLDWPLTDSQLLAEMVLREHDAAPFDVVDVPLWMAQGGVLLERPPCPIVVWLQTSLGHLIELQARPPRAHERVLLGLEARALAQASLVLGDSHLVMDDVQRLHEMRVDAERARVVWLGIDDAGQPWSHHRPLREQVDVLVVGRLEHRKGTPDLLEHLPVLLRAHPEVHVTFVGADNSEGDGFKRETGCTYPETFQHRYPDLAGRVTFSGRVLDDALFEAYRRADLLLHAARYESFGLVFLEAMRAGLPAVAFDAAGAREVHDASTARLVPTQDWAQLIEATSALAADRAARLRMGHAARARFEHLFTADAMAERTLDAYRHAVGSVRTPQTSAAVHASPAPRDWRLVQVTEALMAPDAIGQIIRNQARLLAPFGGARPIQTIYVQPTLAAQTGRVAATTFTTNDAAMLHFYGYSRLERLFAALPGPRVVHYHNITPPQYFPPFSEPFEMTTRGLAQLPRIARLADIITGDSEFNVRACAAALPAPRPTLTLYPLIDRAQLLTHATDPALVEQLAEHKRRHPEEVLLLFVGRVARNKRQDLVIAAAGRLAAGWHRPVRLVLAGGVADPAFRAQLDTIVRQYPRLVVEQPGLISDEQLYAYYRVADAFVCASEHEGFGIPLAEAMAFGVPVIAAAHAAVPETLGDSGILLRTWDDLRAAEAVARVIDRPADREAIVDGQYRNLERFSEVALRDRLRDLVAFLRDGRASPAIVSSDALLSSGVTS